ncbi:pilS cassette [Neisseria meningitidis]|nr:pilS cassette [Neisseria meningitidis]
MTNFRFLFVVFCPCGNDEILSFRNLSGATETAPPSFPRRRESSLVGTETYRENGFLRFCVLDSHFRGNDGIKVSKFILNN